MLVWVPHLKNLHQGTLHPEYLVQLDSQTHELLKKMQRTYVIDSIDEPMSLILLMNHRSMFWTTAWVF